MSDLKHIDEIYKDWCGEHHTTNSCHPVHDSAEACDFAEYYHKVIMEANEAENKINKALSLASINKQRELLIGLLEYEYDEYDTKTTSNSFEKVVDNYLADL